MKRIITIQDISCLGKCSLTVALPVISAMGVECAILPTAVLSTHTMFQNFTCKDLTDQIQPIADHWQKEHIQFDAIYTGYLASAEQIDDVCSFFDRFKTDNNFIFVDPVMADNGKLYAAFDEAFPREMAKVCAKADIIVPNLTEASLLTGLPYRTDYDEGYLKELLLGLSELGPRHVAVTGVRPAEGKVGVMAYDKATGEVFTYYNELLPVSYHGTGDIFASTCVGGLMNGLDLGQALTLAADYTRRTIDVTTHTPDSNWYGVEFERAIPDLLDQLKRLKG